MTLLTKMLGYHSFSFSLSLSFLLSFSLTFTFATSSQESFRRHWFGIWLMIPGCIMSVCPEDWLLRPQEQALLKSCPQSCPGKVYLPALLLPLCLMNGAHHGSNEAQVHIDEPLLPKMSPLECKLSNFLAWCSSREKKNTWEQIEDLFSPSFFQNSLKMHIVHSNYPFPSIFLWGAVPSPAWNIYCNVIITPVQ